MNNLCLHRNFHASEIRKKVGIHIVCPETRKAKILGKIKPAHGSEKHHIFSLSLLLFSLR